MRQQGDVIGPMVLTSLQSHQWLHRQVLAVGLQLPPWHSASKKGIGWTHLSAIASGETLAALGLSQPLADQEVLCTTPSLLPRSCCTACVMHQAAGMRYLSCRYGVNCCPTTPTILAGGCSDTFTQSVAVLELNAFNLSGSLPPEIGNLTSLSALALSDNPGWLHITFAYAEAMQLH